MPPQRPRDAPSRTAARALCSMAFLISSAAAADDFSDFRIPSNRALLWSAGLSSRASSRDAGFPGVGTSNGDAFGSASTRLLWFSDSDPAFTSLDMNLLARGNRTHGSTESQAAAAPSFAQSEASRRAMFEMWSIAASRRNYPWALPIGFDAGLGLAGGYSQSWDSQDSEDLFLAPGSSLLILRTNHSETWRYDYLVNASASLGWGRIRNATGIYDALVMEQRLRETGALTRALSPAGRRRLAEALYLRGALDTVRERPGRALWREIERVLSEDGALEEGGLDPYSVLRATEPHLGRTRGLTSDGIPISPIERPTGAFFGALLRDLHTHSVDRTDGGSSFESIINDVPNFSTTGSFSTHNRQSFDAVDGGASGEIHAPMGVAWQLDASAVTLLGLRKEQNHLSAGSQLALVWLVADRWIATGSASYSWFDDDRTDGPTAGDRWSTDVGLRLSWYIEDRTAIDLSASQHQDWQRGGADASPGDSHFYHRDLQASLGVTYRFSGWIATPGFFSAAGATPLR